MTKKIYYAENIGDGIHHIGYKADVDCVMYTAESVYAVASQEKVRRRIQPNMPSDVFKSKVSLALKEFAKEREYIDEQEVADVFNQLCPVEGADAFCEFFIAPIVVGVREYEKSLSGEVETNVDSYATATMYNSMVNNFHSIVHHRGADTTSIHQTLQNAILHIEVYNLNAAQKLEMTLKLVGLNILLISKPELKEDADIVRACLIHLKEQEELSLALEQAATANASLMNKLAEENQKVIGLSRMLFEEKQLNLAHQSKASSISGCLIVEDPNLKPNEAVLVTNKASN